MEIMVPQGQGKHKDQRGRGEQTNRYRAETREPVILCHGLNNHLSPALQLDYCSCRRPAMKVSRTRLVYITRSAKPLCC